jgi:hypothetical protein
MNQERIELSSCLILLSKKLKYRSYLYYKFYGGDIPPVANSRFPSHSGSFYVSHNADFVINNQVAQCCKCCLSSGGDLFKTHRECFLREKYFWLPFSAVASFNKNNKYI